MSRDDEISALEKKKTQFGVLLLKPQKTSRHRRYKKCVNMCEVKLQNLRQEGAGATTCDRHAETDPTETYTLVNPKP